MNIEDFVSSTEFVYHLTSIQDLDSIIGMGKLLSAKELIARSELGIAERKKILRERRPIHYPIIIGGSECLLRDQRPISEKALRKCLTDGWEVGDFIESLNSRVFFWPTQKRLQIHYDRYKGENPKIIKVTARALIELNMSALRFCHLNSGATRCHPKWKGAPPPRGSDTFRKPEDCDYRPSQVAEVTFSDTCRLPEHFYVGDSPEGPWMSVKLKK